jgi:phytoene dehydrogenase-like protein
MTSYDTIIVGAGICGMSAALELLERREKNILILEADNVIGGRARSMTLPNDEAFNEGANWFHGGDDNPFYQWAKARYDLGALKLDDKGGGEGGDVVWKAGSFDVLQKVFEELEKVFEKAEDKFVSLETIAQSLTSPLGKELIDFMAAGWMAVDDAAQISAHEYFEDPLGPGGWQMADGVGLLIEQMADDIRVKGGDIRCNSVVRSVREQDGAVSVQGDGIDLAANRVLMTVSPSVLASGIISFDDRVLNEMRQKIEDIQMGNLVKVILPADPNWFESSKIENDTPIYMVDDHIFVHIKTAGKPTVTIFKGGQAAHDIETWDLSRVETLVSQTLSQIPLLKDFDKARIGPAIVTGWGKNPYTLGSYSVCAPHHHRPDPFACENIIFTGEAFLSDSQKSPGQMVGAWNAGRMAAKLTV